LFGEHDGARKLSLLTPAGGEMVFPAQQILVRYDFAHTSMACFRAASERTTGGADVRSLSNQFALSVFAVMLAAEINSIFFSRSPHVSFSHGGGSDAFGFFGSTQKELNVSLWIFIALHFRTSVA
jgi:hypothetical protein